MKTVLFFHREELTEMYSSLSFYLQERFNIIHVAYSDNEIKKLKAKGIKEGIINFKEEISILLNIIKLDNTLLSKIDDAFIVHTNGRFNLNSSISSDRGFSNLAYDEAMLLAQVYYLFWCKVFDVNSVDYVMHEMPSLLMNHTCAVICKINKALYISHITVIGEHNSDYLNVIGDNYYVPEIVDTLQYLIDNPSYIEKERCSSFLNEFRATYEIFLGDIINKNNSIFKVLLNVFREKAKYVVKSERDRLVDNIDYWMQIQLPEYNRFKNVRAYSKSIHFDDLVENERYYYYSMHFEPEATVLYMGDGIYENQIKLIQNIAISLPIGCFLYVKDHPHEFGYRNVEDYKKLLRTPNIRLLKHSIPGKKVIKNAIGVFTINGTAGFEALLLKKQVYTFGKSFYSCCSRVNYIHNVRDLRQIINSNQNVIYDDDSDLYPFVNAFLKGSHHGLVDFFNSRSTLYGIDLELNAKQIALDFIEFSSNY